MLIDAHAHVYRRPPGRHVPWPIESFRALLRDHHVAGAVLVQPSFLGTDHGELLDALRSAPAMFRAVAVATDAFSRNEMLLLHEAGTRGIRLNFFRGAEADLTTSAWRKTLTMLEEQGWHLELNARDEDMARLIGQVRGLALPITVDHFGRPDPSLGPSSPGFRALMAAASSQVIYLKLTGTFRTSPELAKACLATWLAEIGAHRALWGSDCPWVEMPSPPGYGQTIAWLDECVASPEERAAVMGENASALFGFPTTSVERTQSPC